MPEHRRARAWPWVAAAAVALLLLAVLGSRLGVSYRTPLTGCILDGGTGGGLGFARWAQRLEFRVRGLDGPVWEAPTVLEHPTGNCLFTTGNGPWSPLGQEATDEQWHALERWLAQGNGMVVVTTAPHQLPRFLRDGMFKPILPDEATPNLSLWTSVVDAKTPTTSERFNNDGVLTVSADGPRGTVPIGRALVAGPQRWQWAAADRGGVLFRIPHGAGAVYLLLDDFAWTNAGLDQGENAEVLAAILRREVRGGVIGVDEYRHGHGRAESFLAYLGHLPGAGSFFLLALLLGLIYFYGRNVRLRPAEEYVPVERRTAREYLDAVSQLHERARAAPLVVEAVVRRFRHLARGPADPRSLAATLLQRAEDYLHKEERPSRPTAAMNLVVDLIRTRKRLYGSRALS